jgi:chromosome segregation ATPase
MFLLTINLNLNILATAVLLAGVVILGITIYFFIISRRSLKQTLQEVNENMNLPPNAPAAAAKAPKTVGVIVNEGANEEKRNPAPQEEIKPLAKPRTAVKEQPIESLKETVLHQQELLTSFLRQVEEIEKNGREELEHQNKELQNEITTLESQLSDKDAELEELKQKASVAERMAARIDEVYQEFEQLQTKISTLERQASKANNLALELEDAKLAYEQIHKDLQRKAEKLEESYSENQRLQQQVNTLEDKLTDANLQRQQLQRKVQFLEGLNTDLQAMSDTNKKLQTELRRVGELESMLNMMAEERDYLLRKKENK